MRRRVPVAVRRVPHTSNMDPATGPGFLCPFLPGSSALHGLYRLGISVLTIVGIPGRCVILSQMKTAVKKVGL